jgi:hypothetical protein
MKSAQGPFTADSVERAMALVALGAVAIARRAFPPRSLRRQVSAEARQAVLAFALAGAGEQCDSLTPRELGFLLALDREQALDAVGELVSRRLAEIKDPELVEDEDAGPLDTGYVLSRD